MSDFIVRFQGLKLADEHLDRVQAAIQKAVLAEISASSIAGYTPDPDGPENGTVVILPNHIWRGIIYMPSAALAKNIKTLTANLGVVER